MRSRGPIGARGCVGGALGVSILERLLSLVAPPYPEYEHVSPEVDPESK